MSPATPRLSTGHLRLVALVSGLLGTFLALVMPLLPVNQKTAEINWSANQNNVHAPLIGYVPIDFTTNIPCNAITTLASSTNSLLISTNPIQAPKATERGLIVRISGNRKNVEVVIRNALVHSAPVELLKNKKCGALLVTANSTETRAEFTGLPANTDQSAVVGTKEGDSRPQVTGLYTESADTLLTAHVTIDTRYSTSAGVLKWAAILLGVLSVLIALGALAMLDSTDARNHRRILPPRWWRLSIRDYTVLGALTLWHFIGANTSDDGYLQTMARVAEKSDYIANYYRWYGAPESPFGWYYKIFGLMSDVSVASPWMRLPALVCGFAVWLIISHEVIPRLGIAVRASTLAGWTAAIVFLVSWFPFNNGLRPEPIICLGTLLTWCSMERATATGRLIPAAFACLFAAFSLAAGPTGLMAVAALIAGAAPFIRALVKRAKVIGGGWISYLSLIAPVAAAGTFVMFITFNNLTLAAFLDSTKMKTSLGPSLKWFNEITRYTALFEFSASGSFARRFAFLTLVCCIILCSTVLIRKRRILGTALGPSRRLVGITAASILLLMFTPTKWTHQLGVFAGLAGGLAALTTVAATAKVMHTKRNRLIYTSLVLFITGLAFTGPNTYFFVSSYSVPWNTSTISLGLALGTLFLGLAIIFGLLALWKHLREPYTLATTTKPKSIKLQDNWKILSTPLLVVSIIVLLFEFGTMGVAALKQYGSYSVAQGNIDALRGDPCGMANRVLVEVDPNTATLQPVNGTLRDSLTGPLRVPADHRVTSGFSPNGIPSALSAITDDYSGKLREVAAKEPLALGGTVDTVPRGSAKNPGLNGSLAALPYNLNPLTTPVLGSYSTLRGQTAAFLTSHWFKLPPKADNSPIITLTAAGGFDEKTVRLEYWSPPPTATSTQPAELSEPAGSIQLVDPGPSPDWRNLRAYRSAIPQTATAVRIVVRDLDLAPGAFVALTPPRVPAMQTLQEFVGSSDPVQVDWTSGMAFPCQRPFTHHAGVAELPRWRITPGTDLTEVATSWQDSFGGGPLGWLEVGTNQVALSSFLAGDIKRIWGTLIHYRPYVPSSPATITLGSTPRNGWWRPAPLKY